MDDRKGTVTYLKTADNAIRDAMMSAANHRLSYQVMEEIARAGDAVQQAIALAKQDCAGVNAN